MYVPFRYSNWGPITWWRQYEFLSYHDYNLPILGLWSPQEPILFVNLVYITRKIYIWSCVTYSLKAIRNSISRSQPKHSRNLKVDNIYFGWKDVEQINVRDKARLKNDSKCRKDVNKNSVNIDQYIMMNAEYMKSFFTDKTVTEVLSYPTIYLNVS